MRMKNILNPKYNFAAKKKPARYEKEKQKKVAVSEKKQKLALFINKAKIFIKNTGRRVSFMKVIKNS